MVEDNFDKGQSVTNDKGEVIAYFSDENGLAYERIPSEQDKMVGAQFIDAKNKEIDAENAKKLAEFQSTEEYAGLGERDQVLASARFKRENFSGKYLGGTDGLDSVYEDMVESYRQTSEYKSLNGAERSIAECNLKVDYSAPDYTAETDPLKKRERLNSDSQYHQAEAIKTGTFIDLRRKLENGEFNVDEAKVAADWLRDNYTNGYDLNGIKRSTKEDLVLAGKTVDKEAPDAIPVRGELDGKIITYVDGKEAEQAYLDRVRGIKQNVDAGATRAVIDALDRDKTLSPEEKNKEQLKEAREYCARTDEDYKRDHSEENRAFIKNNVLRHYPDLAQQLDKEGVNVRLHKDREDANNVNKILEMSPEKGAKIVSDRVEKGAENVGADTSIKENAATMEKGMENERASAAKNKKTNTDVNTLVAAARLKDASR